MSTSACEKLSVSIELPEVELLTPIPLEEVASETDIKSEDQLKDTIDTQGEDSNSGSVDGAANLIKSPSTKDTDLVSETKNCLDTFVDGAQLLQENEPLANTTVGTDDHASTSSTPAITNTDAGNKPNIDDKNDSKSKLGKEAAKEEKKRSKKKEDKSVEYILRVLNSLQSPEEKLAALCKKYADLHEENRVMQNSFKTQQRTLTVVAREKDQLQSEHTKAMIAKSKLESLCRELQKHSKLIKDESIKRAKEDDEKRKEISAQFNVTIGEIQNQMSDNSEKNSRLRKENDNLAEQLRTFISQCQGREEHVKKIQEHHELEKKLAAAKLAQADAILKEVEERGNKEKELILLKLNEVTKKSHIAETQLNLYKTKYDEFNDLHARSSETFQKYKTEMDKMTKRIKKLEKDGLQWKAKWESSSKALVQQYEARTKSEQETTVYLQKTKRLESLCRALQAELHGKKVALEPEEIKDDVKPNVILRDDSPSSAVPETSSKETSPSQPSSDITKQFPAEETTVSISHESSPSPSNQISDPPSVTSPESVENVVTEAIDKGEIRLKEESIANNQNTSSNSNNMAITDHLNVVSSQPLLESQHDQEVETIIEDSSKLTL